MAKKFLPSYISVRNENVGPRCDEYGLMELSHCFNGYTQIYCSLPQWAFQVLFNVATILVFMVQVYGIQMIRVFTDKLANVV